MVVVACQGQTSRHLLSRSQQKTKTKTKQKTAFSLFYKRPNALEDKSSSSSKKSN